MRKSIQNFALSHPLATWLLHIGLMLLFTLGAYFRIPGTRNAGLFLLFTVLGISPPTSILLQRMSNAQRAEYPVSPEQEAPIGLFSLLIALTSIGIFTGLFLSARFGVVWSLQAVAYALVLFAYAIPLAVALGYAARYTKTGQWGMKLALGWGLSLCTVGIVLMLWHLR